MPIFDKQVGEGVPVRRDEAILNASMVGHALTKRDKANEASSDALRTRARGGLPPHIIRRIRQYVEDHIDQTISVKALARIANLSVCYFVRAFKVSVGDTPHEYLMRQRVAVAMRLLSATGMPLSEIAVAAGFVDQSHCSRRFRQVVGMSPREYRCASEQLQSQPQHSAPRGSPNALISASTASTSW